MIWRRSCVIAEAVTAMTGIARVAGAAQVPLVPEEALAGRGQAHARERAQVRARLAGQQGLPLPHQDLPAEEAQGGGLAGLEALPPDGGRIEQQARQRRQGYGRRLVEPEI